MDSIGITKYVKVRMQQRGIGPEVLDDLLAHGRVVHDHRGAEIVYFDQAARRRLSGEQGEEVIRSGATGSNSVRTRLSGGTGKFFTVGHRTRRLYSH